MEGTVEIMENEATIMENEAEIMENSINPETPKKTPRRRIAKI